MTQPEVCFELIGYPLAHSLSPRIHQAAIAALHILGSYRLAAISPQDFPSQVQNLLDRLRSNEIQGMNVTIPYKQAVLPYLDRLTRSAQVIGAVNLIYTQNGDLIGDNSDGDGFSKDLDSYNIGSPGLAYILGAGGSARAVAYALLTQGWDVQIHARRPEQSASLVDHFTKFLNPSEGTRLQSIPLDEKSFVNINQHPQLVVNTTPLGMHPNVNASPWPDKVMMPNHSFIYELIYNPPKTRLIQMALSAGLKTANGIGMLVEQAAISFERWTGKRAPRAAMFASVQEYSIR